MILNFLNIMRRLGLTDKMVFSIIEWSQAEELEQEYAEKGKDDATNP